MMQTYPFPDHIKGDTFNSRKITFPFNITGATIKMEFKYQIGNKVEFFWSTIGNSFTILNANQILMNSRILDSQPHEYKYDLQITFPDGSKKTYFAGTMKIIQDITT